MNDADAIKESIELHRFLSDKQIEEILDLAVSTNAVGTYEGRIEIQTLLDALNTKGIHLSNEFTLEEDQGEIPKGTYEFLYEIDLGEVSGRCQNYGCGHHIRYEEHIRHKESGREFVVGNVCVANLLGEHDLLKVAVSLLAKISNKVDKLNKAEKIKKILGTIPEAIRDIDPDRWFTKDEQKFFDKVDKARSGITIKQAEEIVDTWTEANKFIDLEKMITARKEENKQTKGEARERIKSWNDFLYYKQWENKRRDFHSDFILNCIEDLKVHDQLSPERQNTLQAEKDIYDRIRAGDITLMKNIADAETIKYMTHMLIHIQECDSYFFISILTQATKKKSMSPGQMTAVRERGCGKCRAHIIP